MFDPEIHLTSAQPRLLLALGLSVSLALPGLVGAVGSDDDVATVEGKAIKREDLIARAGDQLEDVETQLLQCQATAKKNRHAALERTVEVLVREELVNRAAAEAGEPASGWLTMEQARHELELSDEKVDEFFSNNQQQLARYKREQVEEQVRTHLATEALYEELKAEYAVDYSLEPYRVEVAASDSPSKGAAMAPVTIVEFSDFQCPYCQRVLPSLQEAVEKYQGQVRLVFRQYPLNNIHPLAAKAAEASLCAREQGKFWEMHDLMFEEQKSLAVADLKDKAGRLGLDGEAFGACLDSARYAEQVEADLSAGSILGVTGTPALFVNGRLMSGAVSFDALKQVIDEELDLVGQSGS